MEAFARCCVRKGAGYQVPGRCNMILIKEIEYDSDSITFRVNKKEDNYYLYYAPGYGYRVFNDEGKVIESYKFFNETIYSRFFEAFKKMENTYNNYASPMCDNFLFEITNLVTDVSFEEGVYTATGKFDCDGLSYTAVAVENFTEEVPSFKYCVYNDKGKELEAYEFLLHALNSKYYVLFELLDKRIREVKEND